MRVLIDCGVGGKYTEWNAASVVMYKPMKVDEHTTGRTYRASFKCHAETRVDEDNGYYSVTPD